METTCRIVDKKKLSDHAYSITFEAGRMVEESFRNPGQFVHIRCGEGLLLRRPISVCACEMAEPENLVRIVFEVRGEGTRWLAQRQTGEALDVLGLLGNGFSVEPGKRYLLVGGGIGVPPLYGCATTVTGGSTAVLAFRSRERGMMEEEFRQVCDRVEVCTDDGSLGVRGYAHELARRILAEDATYDGILACGPRAMLRGVKEGAEEVAIPCQVSMEERMGCGVGACLVCACDMKDGTRRHVCKDGPVFAAGEVDWNG